MKLGLDEAYKYMIKSILNLVGWRWKTMLGYPAASVNRELAQV